MLLVANYKVLHTPKPYTYYLHPLPSHLLLLPGAPSSSSSFISPSTTAFSADSEHSTTPTESPSTEEETATKMEVVPAEAVLEPPSAAPAPAAAATGSASVKATVGGSGGDDEHQLDPEEEGWRQEHVNQVGDSGVSHERVDPGFLSLSEPGKQQCKVEP